MTLTEIFTIIITHWIADFILQTHKQATGKSKNWKDLLDHTLTYSCVWLVPIILISPNTWTSPQYVINAFAFAGITFIAHTITDYFTSRLNTKLLPKREPHNVDEGYFREIGGNIHNFFVCVGFDQVLHYLQLFLTFYYLIKTGGLIL